jgi:hypothetical protein
MTYMTSDNLANRVPGTRLARLSLYQNLYHHASNARFSISHQFFVWKICRTPVSTMFSFVWILYKNVHNLFCGATSTEEKWHHDVFCSLRLQRHLLSSRFPLRLRHLVPALNFMHGVLNKTESTICCPNPDDKLTNTGYPFIKRDLVINFSSMNIYL